MTPVRLPAIEGIILFYLKLLTIMIRLTLTCLFFLSTMDTSGFGMEGQQ